MGHVWVQTAGCLPIPALMPVLFKVALFLLCIWLKKKCFIPGYQIINFKFLQENGICVIFCWFVIFLQ